jgi:serine phosphatase RsbU (regulator of sigma subunit)
MPQVEVAAYPWQSDTIFAAVLDATGAIRHANRALVEAVGSALNGARFSELVASEQRDAFETRLGELTDEWTCALFSFEHERSGATDDRRLWMRRDGDRSVELFAEPAWQEHARLVEQVLQLNDDLIAIQRTLSRRQRELQRAEDEAARSAVRIRQLEAIVLAGLTPQDFDEALRSLLTTAQAILPGDRADILLLDDAGERMVLRASAGPGAPTDPERRPVVLGEGLLGTIAARGASTLIEDLETARRFGVPLRAGSLIATPLRLRGEVIGVLVASSAVSGSFSEADLRLLEVVGERVALAIGQAQLRDREQQMAEVLQRTLLPQSLPTVPGIQLAAAYNPRTATVGGDFYDAIALPDGKLGVAIGDVTGKGLRAAAAMGRLRSALHAYALDSPGPAHVLERVDRLAGADGTMATALYLVIDPSTGQVDLASAGHLPPLRIDGSTATYLELSDALSPPLGVAVAERRMMSFELARGSALVLFTDGLVEVTRNVDEGLELLRRAAAKTSADALDRLLEELQGALAPVSRYRDDVALLALRRSA